MGIEEAKQLLNSGEVERARTSLLELVESNPGNDQAWLLLAGLATRSEDWGLAETSFTALVQLRPGDGIASSGLVQSLIKHSRYREAADEIDRFMSAADRSKLSSEAVLQEHLATLERIKDMV